MDKKATHIEEMENRLKELDAKIGALEKQIQERHSRTEMHLEKVYDLRLKHKNAHERLEEIRKATHEEWENLRSGWEEIIKDMQEVMDRLASEY